MKFVRIIAPYVTLKARDSSGAFVVRGMYKGGTLPIEDVDPESLQHHLDGEMVEVFSSAATPEGDQPKPGAAQNPPAAPETVEDQSLAKADEPKKAAPAKKTAA